MKTLKGWQKSNVDLGEYLGNAPCRINEGLYNYIAECVPVTYCSEGFMQGGDCEFIEDGVEFYMTGRYVDDKFYYLGILPAFQQ